MGRDPEPELGWTEDLPVRSLSFLYPAGHHRVASDLGPLEGVVGFSCAARGLWATAARAGDVESASSF